MKSNNKIIETKKYRVRNNTAYLTKEGETYICVQVWCDSLKLFERSDGDTPFCVGNITHFEAVNVMRVLNDPLSKP